MATLTIRDIDESLKLRLRMRAASRNRSMEEEARQILRAALSHEPVVQGQDMASRIRARVAPLGGVALSLAPREPVRAPPAFDEPLPAAETSRRAARRPSPARARRR